jgi:hypothetical protein
MDFPARRSRAPQPQAHPFAGYIRSSVLFFQALRGVHGIRLCDLGERPNLFEAYPGHAWRILAGGALPSKATQAGRRARVSLLTHAGCALPDPNIDLPTHDQLDAAVCAFLGSRHPAMNLAGEPCREEDGRLREGRILTAGARLDGWIIPHNAPVPGGQPAAANAAGEHAAVAELGGAHWIYFATAAMAAHDATLAFACAMQILWRPPFNQHGNFIANVQHVQPGQRVLLVYGGNGVPYTALGLFQVDVPDAPVEGAPALGWVTDPELVEALAEAGYHVQGGGQHAAFHVSYLEAALPDFDLPRLNQNALVRADQVWAAWQQQHN